MVLAKATTAINYARTLDKQFSVKKVVRSGTQMILLELVLAGVIERHSGNRVSRQ